MSSADRLMASDLVDDIEFLAARARSVGTAHTNHLLEPLGLKVRSYAILSLACSELAPSQRELADFLSLDASQIVALVDDLEGRGLVTRQPDARDRRSNAIAATPAGHELYRNANEAARAGQDAALRALNSAERDTLRTLLKRVAFEV